MKRPNACGECARREVTISTAQTDLKNLAYAAQSRHAGRASAARAKIPGAKHSIMIAKERQAEHLEVCTADGRHGIVA